MKPLISLVIPVYNVEEFLPKCMETVLAQTYENFEVILVDDGSTDGSGRLCDDYAASDMRIKVFHKANGGLSDARNFGVQHAGANLISIIDSDDYITEDYLSYLYELMEKYDADLSWANAAIVHDLENIKVENIQPRECVLNAEQALERACYVSVGADTKLYKKELLLQNPFPVGRLYEDLATTYKILGDCKRLAVSNKVLYFWVQRRGSIIHSSISEKQFDIFLSASELWSFIRKDFPNIEIAAKTRYVSSTISFMTRLFLYSDSKNKEYFYRARNYAKDFLWPVIFNKRAKFMTKLGAFFIWLGYTPSRLLWSLKRDTSV